MQAMRFARTNPIFIEIIEKIWVRFPY